MINVIDEHHLRVGERTWWGEYHTEEVPPNDLMLYGWKARQFVVLFENKWRVSVIWGYATYSDNHDMPWYPNPGVFNETPMLVEAGVLHADRDGLQPDGEPYAYIDEEQLNALLEMVSLLPSEAHFSVIRDDVANNRDL